MKENNEKQVMDIAPLIFIPWVIQSCIAEYERFKKRSAADDECVKQLQKLLPETKNTSLNISSFVKKLNPLIPASLDYFKTDLAELIHRGFYELPMGDTFDDKTILQFHEKLQECLKIDPSDLINVYRLDNRLQKLALTKSSGEPLSEICRDIRKYVHGFLGRQLKIKKEGVTDFVKGFINLIDAYEESVKTRANAPASEVVPASPVGAESPKREKSLVAHVGGFYPEKELVPSSEKSAAEIEAENKKTKIKLEEKKELEEELSKKEGEEERKSQEIEHVAEVIRDFNGRIEKISKQIEQCQAKAEKYKKTEEEEQKELNVLRASGKGQQEKVDSLQNLVAKGFILKNLNLDELGLVSDYEQAPIEKANSKDKIETKYDVIRRAVRRKGFWGKIADYVLDWFEDLTGIKNNDKKAREGKMQSDFDALIQYSKVIEDRKSDVTSIHSRIKIKESEAAQKLKMFSEANAEKDRLEQDLVAMRKHLEDAKVQEPTLKKELEELQVEKIKLEGELDNLNKELGSPKRVKKQNGM